MSTRDDWPEEVGAQVERALHESAVTPSSDLFARVVDSIDADRRRRHNVKVVAARWSVGVIAAVLAIAFSPRTKEGALDMPWWTLELVTTAVLVGIALWLGPFIKRFGRAYAADVFHDNPLTGKSYIILTDVVYYLIFSAYILFTVQFAPPESWRSFADTVTANQAQAEVARIGGILLIIGVLHGLNIVLMPVLGRLFSLNRRLPAGTSVQSAASAPPARSIYERAAELEREADDGPR